jgi:hypothetical protein
MGGGGETRHVYDEGNATHKIYNLLTKGVEVILNISTSAELKSREYITRPKATTTSCQHATANSRSRSTNAQNLDVSVIRVQVDSS